jgi:hypothetical protein
MLKFQATFGPWTVCAEAGTTALMANAAPATRQDIVNNLFDLFVILAHLFFQG